jgi:hypothetical protein
MLNLTTLYIYMFLLLWINFKKKKNVVLFYNEVKKSIMLVILFYNEVKKSIMLVILFRLFCTSCFPPSSKEVLFSTVTLSQVTRLSRNV